MKERIALMSKRPDLVEEALNVSLQQSVIFNVKVNQILEKMGVDEAWKFESAGAWSMGGYYLPSDEFDPLPDFKPHPELEDVMIPDQSTRNGCLWTDLFFSIAMPIGLWPGLPQIVITPEGISSFTVLDYDDGEWYATLPCMAPKDTLAAIDWKLWEPMKINDFYMVKEMYGDTDYDV